jgi:hypothetical protein
VRKARPRRARTLLFGVAAAPVAITKPFATQGISSIVAPTPACRWGMATFTMDASMMPINVPKVTESATSHLLWGVLGLRLCMREARSR